MKLDGGARRERARARAAALLTAAALVAIASCARTRDAGPLLASARAAQDEADWARAFADYSAAAGLGGGEPARWGAWLAQAHVATVRAPPEAGSGAGGSPPGGSAGKDAGSAAAADAAAPTPRGPAVRDVAFLQDGTALALVAGELRDVATGTARAPAPAGATFEGPLLVSREASTARLLTLDGALVATVQVPASASLAVASDGRGLVIYDGGLDVVALPDGLAEPLRARLFAGPQHARLALAGFLAAVRTDDGALQLWNTRARRLVARRTGVGAPFALAPDGSTLVWEDAAGVHLGPVDGARDRTLGPPVHATRFAFSADGALVAACAADALRVWDRREGTLAQKLALPSAACAISADSSAALAGGVLIALPRRTAHPRAPWAILGAYFPSPGELVTFANDGKVATSDVPSGDEHAGVWVRAPAACGSTVLSASAGKVAAAGEKRAVVWRHADRDLVEVLRVDGQFSAAALAAGALVASSFPAKLVAFDAGTGAVRWQEDSFACALASNGPLVAVGGRDGTLRLLDAATGALRARLPPLQGPVRALAFSADGARLAAGAATLVVYSVGDTQAQQFSVPLAARAVAFSRDPALLAAGGDDGVVRIYRDGRELATLPPLGAAASAVAFSPDGLWLASGSSAGGGARLTRLPPAQERTGP